MDWIFLNSELTEKTKFVVFPQTQKRVLVAFKYLNSLRITIAEYIPYRTIRAEDYLDENCDEDFIDYDEKNNTEWVSRGWFESPLILEGYGNFMGKEYEVVAWKFLPDLPK